MSKVNLSEHSKERLFERTNVETRDFLKNVKSAHSKGLNIGEFKNASKALKKYLSLRRRGILKYYKGNFYIFARSKKLITVYPPPDYFLEELEKIWKERRGK